MQCVPRRSLNCSEHEEWSIVFLFRGDLRPDDFNRSGGPIHEMPGLLSPGPVANESSKAPQGRHIIGFVSALQAFFGLTGLATGA